MLGRVVLLAASCLCSRAGGSASSDFVTTEDLKFRDDADLAAKLWCSSYEGGMVSEEEGRRALEIGVGGDNFILEAITEADNTEEIRGALQGKLQTFSPVYYKGIPVVAAVLLLLVWGVMCCTAFPCKACGCCRCCKRSWECSTIVKAIAFGFVLLTLGGLGVCAFMAYQGTKATNNGVEGVACSAAQLVHSTYAGGGSGSNKFMGVLPTLQEFDVLDAKLDTGSPFMTEIDSINSTESIDKVVMVASRTLKLLKDALENAANKDPTNNDGASLGHHGLLSDPDGLPALLGPAIEALDTGVAVALANARSETKDQLSEEKRQDLQSQLKSAITPLKDAKDSMRTGLKDVVDPDIHTRWEGKAELSLFGLVMGLFVLALLVMCCGCSSIGCCLKSDEGNNHVHRLACTTWCCSFSLAVIALLIGGIMLLVGVPLSGVCLILADVDRPMLNDISGAIHMDMTGDEGVMLGDMVEHCFNPANPDTPASLMDILFERNGTFGEKVTLREKMIDKFKSKIDDQFSAVTAKLGLNLTSLAEDSRIENLRAALASNPVDQMLLPKDTLTSSSDYAALSPGSVVTSAAALSEAALNSSASCDSHYSSLVGRGVGGISAFLTELQALGTSPTLIANGLSCTQTVTCNAGDTNAACEAGNKLMLLKAALLSIGGAGPDGVASENRYRCDLFTVSGSECDVLNMPGPGVSASNAQMCVQDSSGSYTMSTTPIQCNLAQFVTYVADFSSRLEKVFARVDSETEVVKSAINVNLRQTLDNHVMGPLDNMADSMQCNFLAPLYANVVDSFCYQSMWGFHRIAVSYSALGFLQLALIPLMYTIYRVGRDKLDEPKLTQRKESI